LRKNGPKSLALDLYALTKVFPEEERYGLVSQLRRAVVSVPANIAEGSKRQGRQDYARFLNIAEGSLAETEYLLILSRDLGYIKTADAETKLAEVEELARMLNGLRVKVEPSG
jgi:four helix bundle protein